MNQETALKRRIPLVTSLLAVLVGIAFKLTLTSGALLPGLDGAYYWVQVRSVLDNFSLAFSDLPFVFWVQSLIAWVVGDIPLGVRISDAVLPALSAIPIYLIMRKHKNPFLPAIAILVGLLNPIQLFFFTGDFIKNEAAIPAVFFIAWILINWEEKSKRFSITCLAIALTVITLSHFGTLLLALMVTVGWLLAQQRKSNIKFWLRGIGVSVIAFAAVLGILALLVPSRYERLINLITSPNQFIQSPAISKILHGSATPVMLTTILIGQLGAITLGIVAFSAREKIKYSDLSLIISSLITTFLLSLPLIGMEWSDRLAALSFVPLAIAAMVIIRSVEIQWQKASIGILVAVTLLSTFQLSFAGIQKSVFSDAQYVEFKKLVANVNIPSGSVIVARHGIEYLSAWEFSTDVALDTYYQSADLSSYTSVYYIEELNSGKQDAPAAPAGQKGPPSSTMDKPDTGTDSTKTEPLTGETIFENGSFALVKIR